MAKIEFLYNSYIYRFTNKINNKVYIGSTSKGAQRYKSHLSANSCSVKLLRSAMKKYGSNNFNFEVLEYINSFLYSKKELRDLLLEREQVYLDFYFAQDYINSDFKDKRFKKLTYNLSPLSKCGIPTHKLGRINRDNKQLTRFCKIDKNLNVEYLFNIRKYCKENKFPEMAIFNSMKGGERKIHKGFTYCREEDLHNRLKEIKENPTYFNRKKFPELITCSIVIKDNKTGKENIYTSIKRASIGVNYNYGTFQRYFNNGQTKFGNFEILSVDKFY